MSHTIITTIETRDQAHRRLLEVARESGVQLKIDEHGNYWATSVSEPGLLHPVAPDSCSCRGFRTHHRCRHVAALMSHLGYFDPEPDPIGAALPSCSRCMDAGMVDEPHARWIGGSRTGFRDEWSTAVPCPQCGEVAA
jgi:hypothetical protein